MRLRLTFLYIGLFLASAVCLLIITYVLVAHQLSGTVTSLTSTGHGATSSVLVNGGSAPGCGPSADGVPPTPAQMTACLNYLAQQASDVRAAALRQLLLESGLALGIMAVASVGLGWLMAGRVLSPLRVITATARRISASSLHRRIAMTGPEDELKELGDTFDQLLGRLEASFGAQRQFVANASHELRTPLARQRTLLEVALRDRQATDASLRAACERALAAGEQQERLIAAMLTLARSERGLDKFEPLDLRAVAAGVLAVHSDEAAAGGVGLRSHLQPAPVLGDVRLAERLVANLVDNAIRYNRPDGRVEVTTGTRAGRPFLSVNNTGPVIAEQDVARLLRPFERLVQARTSADRPGGHAGLGLGLAIVTAIAAAHNAELHAVAQPAGGLAMEILFPLPLAEPARAEIEPAEVLV